MSGIRSQQSGLARKIEFTDDGVKDSVDSNLDSSVNADCMHARVRQP